MRCQLLRGSRCNIVQLYRLFGSPEEVQAMEDSYRRGGYGYGHAKQDLLAKIKETFGPMRERYETLHKNPDDLFDRLQEGARRVRAMAR
jgi:tryptophanyl-tRNA synthetase